MINTTQAASVQCDAEIKLPPPILCPSALSLSYNITVSLRGRLFWHGAAPGSGEAAGIFGRTQEVQYWTRGWLAKSTTPPVKSTLIFCWAAPRICIFQSILWDREGGREREREGWERTQPQRHLLAVTGRTLWWINTSQPLSASTERWKLSSPAIRKIPKIIQREGWRDVISSWKSMWAFVSKWKKF